jgi:cell fate regulator YaaT (PSP1 superfamily)
MTDEITANGNSADSKPHVEPRAEPCGETPAEPPVEPFTDEAEETPPKADANAETRQVTFAVQIGKLRRSYPFAASQDFAQHAGRAVIVDADYGLDMGVLSEPWQGDGAKALGAIVRLADADDFAQTLRNAETDAECRAAFNEAVAGETLQMKIVGVDHSYERTKITFYYHAEGRVDFRQLVKALASKLRRRIELYQLNLRDQFLFHPFLGPCGRELCCKAKPELFSQKVPTRLAKQQKLSYNPAKMAGMCGKPRCCLRYEVESYKEFADFLGVRPGRAFKRRSDGRECKLVDWHMLTDEVIVETREEEELTFSLAEFKRDFAPVTATGSKPSK